MVSTLVTTRSRIVPHSSDVIRCTPSNDHKKTTAPKQFGQPWLFCFGDSRLLTNLQARKNFRRHQHLLGLGEATRSPNKGHAQLRRIGLGGNRRRYCWRWYGQSLPAYSSSYPSFLYGLDGRALPSSPAFRKSLLRWPCGGPSHIPELRRICFPFGQPWVLSSSQSPCLFVSFFAPVDDMPVRQSVRSGKPRPYRFGIQLSTLAKRCPLKARPTRPTPVAICRPTPRQLSRPVGFPLMGR